MYSTPLDHDPQEYPSAKITPIRSIQETKREWRPMMPPDLYSADIGVNAIAVYGVLALHVDGRTGECWPSYATITKRLGLSRATIYRAIKILEAAGFVLIENHHKEGRSNTYTLPHQVHTRITGDTPPVSEEHPSRITGDTPPVSLVTPKPNVIEPNVIEPNVTPLTPLGGGIDKTTQEPTEKTTTYPEDMLAFWNAYDPKGRNRSSRESVLKAWKKIRPSQETVKAIMAGVVEWRTSDEWQRGYAMGAHRFLNERKWEEPPEVLPSAPALNGHITDDDLDKLPMPEKYQDWADRERQEFFDINGAAAPFPPHDIARKFRDMKRKHYMNGGAR